MTNQERINKFIKEKCKDCENKKTDLCEIKILQGINDIVTQCSYYKKNKEKKEVIK